MFLNERYESVRTYSKGSKIYVVYDHEKSSYPASSYCKLETCSYMIAKRISVIGQVQLPCLILHYVVSTISEKKLPFLPKLLDMLQVHAQLLMHCCKIL